MTQNRVRIVDVADALGLSTATISNVIHGKTEKISDETVKRVQQELERSGYIPNMAGILLARNNSRTIGESYEVRKLLDKVRICMIPMLNPDSYEICEYGYGAIHNPIHRQMLKMQDRPVEEYECNARGIDLRRNFPTNYYQRKRVNQEPASENETRALISIFQEYSSLGLLTFSYSRGKIVYCRQEKGFAYNQKNYRLARHLQKCSGYRLEKGIAGGARVKKAGAKPEMGSPEQFYAEVIRQPSLAIEIPEYRKDDMEELRLIPLEYLYSLNSGILANA